MEIEREMENNRDKAGRQTPMTSIELAKVMRAGHPNGELNTRIKHWEKEHPNGGGFSDVPPAPSVGEGEKKVGSVTNLAESKI